MADILATLQSARYNGVAFVLSHWTVDGGHDAVHHKAYRRRGADLDWTGQREYTGTFRVPLLENVHGSGFTGPYYDLIAAFEASAIGTLSTPTKGNFDALIQNWHEEGDADVRDGVWLTVQWTEHNATASLLLSDPTTGPVDTPAAAEAQAQTADDAGASFVGYLPVLATVQDQLAVIESGVATYATVTGALRTIDAACAANLALPSIVGEVAAHDVVAALEALRATLVSLQSRYLPATDRITYYTPAVAMADYEIAYSVYGSAQYASLIRKANPIADPGAYPAGIKLTILPAT